MTIYLDHAAATPLDADVLAAMRPYFTDKFYNPSALYGAAHDVARDLAKARADVAAVLGARPVEITFTAGGTEANNLAIHGVMAAHPGKKVIVSTIEHDSVLETARQYGCLAAPVTEQGIIDTAQLRKLIDDDTVLVSLMYANNEIGTIQPIAQVAELVADVRKDRKPRGVDTPLYVHTDASQAANYLDLHVSRLGIDLMSLNGSKIYGPRQTGALYVRGGVVLKPLLYGGGQEHGLRSGTENVAGAAGFAVALQKAQAMRSDEVRRLQALQDYFFAELVKAFPPAKAGSSGNAYPSGKAGGGIIINGWRKKRLPNNVHVTFPGQDNERLLYALDERGVMAAAGSACSAGSDEASHVLSALGLDEAAARASLRFTMGRGTTQADIDATVAALRELLG